MEAIKEFDITQVPVWKIVFIVTSEPDYQMDRTILVEDYPEYGDYTLISGSHCSCYDFDDTKWDATTYSAEELRTVVTGWLKHGYGSERAIAPLVLDHIKRR